MSAGYTSPIDAEVKKGKKGKKEEEEKRRKEREERGASRRGATKEGWNAEEGKGRKRERGEREREPFNKSMNIANNSSLVPE